MNVEKLRDTIYEKAFNAIYDVVEETLKNEISSGGVDEMFSFEEVYCAFLEGLRGCCDDCLVSDAVWEAVAEVKYEALTGTLH